MTRHEPWTDWTPDDAPPSGDMAQLDPDADHARMTPGEPLGGWRLDVWVLGVGISVAALLFIWWLG